MTKETDRLLYNAIQTPDGTIIESKHRHDYVTHLDKNGKEYMVDGGLDYSRRNVYEDAPYKELSVYDDGEHETRRKYIKWGINYTKDMKRLPNTIFKPIMDLETDHIQAILDGNHTKNTFYLGLFNDELEYRLKK